MDQNKVLCTWKILRCVFPYPLICALKCSIDLTPKHTRFEGKVIKDVAQWGKAASCASLDDNVEYYGDRHFEDWFRGEMFDAQIQVAGGLQLNSTYLPQWDYHHGGIHLLQLQHQFVKHCNAPRWHAVGRCSPAELNFSLITSVVAAVSA